jgi:hypothetical protein
MDSAVIIDTAICAVMPATPFGPLPPQLRRSLESARPHRHVDFQALGAPPDLGARSGPVTGRVPQRLGIETRAVTLMAKTTPRISPTSPALKRLTDSGRGVRSMGKAVAITEPHSLGRRHER